MRLASVFALSLALASCVSESINDDISTELTISSPGAPGQWLEIRKRFRFSHDPAQARGVYFDSARLQILAPVDADLSFISRLHVYAIHPDGGSVLVATAEGLTPGTRVAAFDIVYDDDLREFAGDDSRIAFSFRIEPSVWVRPYPPEGFTVLAVASIDIEI